MPAEIEEMETVVNEEASTSSVTSATLKLKEDKKKNSPWIEKYRPKIFEEIMGKLKTYIERVKKLR